jgi:fatty acid desaturase
MTYEEQLLDSINLEGIPIATELFFPLGLRFHALHHVFPTVPYHNLAAAHHRLMQGLPADSPYRRTVFPGYFAALRQLWRDARASRHQHQHVVPAPIFAYRQSDTSTNA